jgi:hypothetical protein
LRELSKDEGKHVLTDLLNRIELGIIQLKPSNPLHERLAADCFDQYKEFARARWSLLLGPQNTLPAPFLRMLVAWLMMIFLCFGLRAPDDPLIMTMIALSAATLSSMIFAIMDIVDPYKGLYNISSKNMHQALGAMLRPTVTGGHARPLHADGDPARTLTEAPHDPGETGQTSSCYTRSEVVEATAFEPVALDHRSSRNDPAHGQFGPQGIRTRTIIEVRDDNNRTSEHVFGRADRIEPATT